MMVTKILITAFLFISVSASDLCPKNKDPKTVAKDLISIEMSGIRLITGTKKQCLKEEFKDYRFNHDPDYDDPKNLEYILDSKSNIKIEKVELIDKEIFQYRASYQVNVVDTKGNSSVIKDRITFMLNTTSKSQKVGGCAMVIEPPEKLVLLKSCQK